MFKSCHVHEKFLVWDCVAVIIESQKKSKEKGVKRAVTEKVETETQPRLNTSKSVPTETAHGGKTWAADDSPLTPRKSVSFKRDKELSQVHDIVSF